MPEPDGYLTGAHVLILEDEMLIRMDLEQTLREMGCLKVTAVGRAADALAAIKDDPGTLALLDIQLAEGTSYEVAATLQRGGIPFVFTSGSEGDEVPAAFAGVTFLDKPFEPASLVSVLASALQH